MDAQYPNHARGFSPDAFCDPGRAGATAVKSLFLSVLLVSGISAGSAQTPVVHAQLEPATGIIVGQPVHLIVEVLAPNYFTGSPDFPIFELENAIVVLPEETPVHLNQKINGQTYAGIQRTYSLYPQQPGEFQLPPAQLTVPYASAPPKSSEAKLTLPPLKFHADIPAEARGLGYFLPTARLTLQQGWSSSLKNLRVGDTVNRTITVTTAKMQGMLIPPLALDAPAGIRVYPEEPKVLDQKTDRGEFVFGRRIEAVKYFIQKDGNYTLTAIELKWWNLGSHRLETATLPAVHFTAAPNPDYVAELPPEPEPVIVAQPKRVSLLNRYRWVRFALPTALVLFLFAWLMRRYGPQVYGLLKTRRERFRHSEAVYFNKLDRACRRDDARKAYIWLLQWLRSFGAESSLDQFLQTSDDAELTRQVNNLTATLFGKQHEARWNGRAMASCLARRRGIPSLHLQQGQRLPSLNPLAGDKPRYPMV
jgi:BatD DUF11 like domain